MTARALLLCSVLVLACSRGSATPEDEDTGAGAQGGSAGADGSSGAGAATGGGMAQAGSAAGGAAGGGGGGAVSLPPLEHETAGGVFVHLFEWRWADVARECETFLGPKGFTAVQVSPVNEHALLPGYGYPWWQRYQPVSYALESRSGTRADFAEMVARCREAGVGIYVDAVLNHMTGMASGTGSAGTKFTKYSYPGLFEQSDFHAPVCQIQGSDYATSAENVQRCELVGLSDLDTGNEAVQAKLAAYLSDLLHLGVRGFRIDAAKHMSPPDLAGVLAKVAARGDEAPYYFLEVIDHGGEAVHSSDYLDVSDSAELDVTEFRYRLVGDAFLGRGGATLATLAELSASTDTFLASERAVVFVNNHDTQRGDAAFYQDGAAHDLATVFMLAWPYGYPSVMSSFGFDRSTGPGRDEGPPSAAGGVTQPIYAEGATEPDCVPPPLAASTAGWICEHRQRHVANMVAFRRDTETAPVSHSWDNGQNQLAFAREGRGFVAINHELVALEQSLQTGLPPGDYCDVLSGDFTAAQDDEPASCSGALVPVDATGTATIMVAPETALAIHLSARLGSDPTLEQR